MRVLIVYGSHYGQTRTISERIASRLRTHHHQVELYDAEKARVEVPLEGIGAVLVGSSIEAGKHARAVVGFVREHRDLLNAKVSAFFTVCLARAENTDQGRREVQRYLEGFIRDARWTPEQEETFAGALMYRRYNWFMRTMMCFIAKRAGLPVDTSRNHEFTDWAAVDAFADQFAARLEDHGETRLAS